MRIGLIADIHGNAPGLKAVFSALWDSVELVLFAGDLAGYYPFVNECVEMWDPDLIVGILGNHDEVLLKYIEYGTPSDPEYRERFGTALERSKATLSKKAQSLLESWPIHRSLTVSSVSISIYHGSPWDPLNGRIYPDYDEWQRFDAYQDDVILLGHTHYPLVKRYRDKLILNPGSVGQPRDRLGGACYAVLDLGSGEVFHYRIPYDCTPVLRDAVHHDPDIPYLVEVLGR